MELDKYVVSIFSFFGILFTYWFFLMKKEKEAVIVSSDSIDITVEGGYSPNVISVTKNKQVTLNFYRKDPSTCLEEVVIPDFKIKKYLPLNQVTSIDILPRKNGTFEISCGMNMFHGKILVQD